MSQKLVTFGTTPIPVFVWEVCMTDSWTLDAFAIGSVILIVYPLLVYIIRNKKERT